MSRATTLVRELSAHELLLLVAAPLALPLAALGLRLFGLKRMERWLDRRSLPQASEADNAAAHRLARIVGAAVLHGPWPANCLQRSLVLWWYLHLEGIAGDLRIGVRRDPAGSGLLFHAWVEHAGEVINDSPTIRSSYVSFDRPIAPGSARFS